MLIPFSSHCVDIIFATVYLCVVLVIVVKALSHTAVGIGWDCVQDGFSRKTAGQTVGGGRGKAIAG